MVWLGFRNCFTNIHRNLLQVFQMALLMFLGIFMTTTFVRQTSLFSPYSDYFDGNGFVLFDCGMDARNPENLYDKLEKTDDVNYIRYSGAESGGQSFIVYGFDKMALGYKPTLIKGKWLSEKRPYHSGRVNAVVSYTDKLDVGDDIEMEVSGEKGGKFTVHICGMIANTALMLDPNGQENEGKGIRQYYSHDDYYFMDESMRTVSMIITDKAFADQFDGYFYSTRFYVRFKDDISTEELEENKNRLISEEYAVINSFDKVSSESRQYIFSKLVDVIPIALGSLILICISVAGVVLIDSKKRLTQYSVYYICGMKWYKCCIISMIQSFILAVTGFVLAVMAGGIMLRITGREKVMFEIGGSQILVCVLLLVYILVVSFLLPLHIIRKYTPVEIFKEKT